MILLLVHTRVTGCYCHICISGLTNNISGQTQNIKTLVQATITNNNDDDNNNDDKIIKSRSF